MSFLDKLLGDSNKRQQLQDFIGRFEQGAPHEGYSDEEAINHHEEIASQLSPDEYRQAAEEAVSRLSPEERLQLGQHLIEQARAQGLDPSEAAQDEQQLSSAGGLGSLLGGGGSMLSNPLAKAALGGIAAMAAKRILSRR